MLEKAFNRIFSFALTLRSLRSWPLNLLGNSMVSDVHFRQFCTIFSHKFINIYNSKSVLSCLQVALLNISLFFVVWKKN